MISALTKYCSRKSRVLIFLGWRSGLGSHAQFNFVNGLRVPDPCLQVKRKRLANFDKHLANLAKG